MSKTIQIKRGLKPGIPTLNEGELAYTTDTKELYIGTDSGNEILNPEFIEQGLANVFYFTTMIATGNWSGTDPVTAAKTVTGILATDKPLIDLDLSSVDFLNVEAKQTEYGKIYRVAATGADEITFFALEVPTEELVINIKVVR
jgi:hypothetical protein